MSEDMWTLSFKNGTFETVTAPELRDRLGFGALVETLQQDGRMYGCIDCGLNTQRLEDHLRHIDNKVRLASRVSLHFCPLKRSITKTCCA